jgi:hypothetical protein
MTIVIFIGMSLLLGGGISTGPHVYWYWGLTHWLTLHRYGDNWSVDDIKFLSVVVEIAVAVLLTWVLLKILAVVRQFGKSRRPRDGSSGEGSVKRLLSVLS